ncbi:CASP8-associated protein 2 [Megalops cyprinoides]|uniref:CASP8-associated protein 2 n=1 Tax=Megalops cyprinoides TaxID=118141 RepID=UPI00186532EB|nr:CASP8-associated protein 2 [Megalops cyprinoides]
MEEALLDQMYGDLGHGQSGSPAVHDEDSVDIYSGLDNSPRNSEHAGKLGVIFSPKLKESMDLYEEIITEEQQERNATCSELKTKLDAAQNKIKELMYNLQQMQIQNANLQKENTSLKKNICALIKTARMEIVRKDEEINRLNQRSGRGGYGQSFPRAQTNFQRNQGGGGKSAVSHDPLAHTRTQEPKVNCAPKELSERHSDTRTSVSLQPGPPHKDVSLLTPPCHESSRGPRADSLLPSRHNDSAVIKSGRDSRKLQSSSREEPNQQTSAGIAEMPQKVSEKQSVPSQDIKGGQSQRCQGRDLQNYGDSGVNEESKVKAREKVDKELKESGRDCVRSSRSRREHLSPEPPRRSDKGRSPPRRRKPSPSSGSSQHATSSIHSSRTRSRDLAEEPSKGSSREHRHSNDRDKGDRSSQESVGKEGKPSVSSGRRGEECPAKEQHRREERRREEQSRSRAERSSNRTERSKEYERSKGKDVGKSDREGTRKMGERKRGNESERHADSRSSRQATPPRKSAAGTDSSDPVKKDKHQVPVRKEGPLKSSDESERAAECEGAEKNLPEESENRKLNFMERLNLTLSPAKKPRLSSGGKEESSRPEDAEDSRGEDSGPFDLGEDYCVIDELDSSRDMVQERDEVFEAPAAKISGSCGAENAPGPPSDPGLADTESAIQRPVSDEEPKLNAESGGAKEVDENTVLQKEDGKLQTDTVADDIKQMPMVTKNCGSVSETEDANVVKTTTPAEALDLHSAADNCTGDSVVETVKVTDDPCVCSSSPENSKSTNVESVVAATQDPVDVNMENCSADNNGSVQSECQKSPLVVPPEAILQDAPISVVMDTCPEGDETGGETCDMSTDAVSSTVSIEVVSQSVEAVSQSSDNTEVAPAVVETVIISSTEQEKDVEKTVLSHSLPTAESVEMANVSSTIVEDVGWSRPGQDGSAETQKAPLSSEPDSTEDEERNAEPSSSVPVPNDEDSMMLTLKSIRHIPEAISPLTSPVRPVKKSQPHSSGKSHIKSLSKDFSTVTGTRRMDVNKENEKPDCSSAQTAGRDSDQNPPSASSSTSSEDENELEEGEIVSNSEEDDTPVTPSPKPRKTHCATTAKNQPSPKSPRLAKKQAEKAAAVSKGSSGTRSKTTASPNNSPLSNKKQFKTILPLLPRTNPSTISEVMDMLKLIRTQLRKKYMKLHKNFPKKSFSNIVDMSLFSFTDFVNNVNFSKFCSLESILKPKLNSIISATMNKISNNGIVTRIFEQQSPSLKKKLWTFVEDQFDFLFREIQAALTSLCKVSDARHLPKTENNVERNKDKKEMHKIQAKSPVTASLTTKRKAGEVASIDTSGLQDKKTKPTPAVPYRTGLGSRGKNLRMNKEEEDQVSETQKQEPLSVQSPPHSAVSPSKTSPPTEKTPVSVRRLSHSTSLQDRSDFEILTEQQASSLTFNLVTDSQMGEIFKCLLQGSDLLETSVPGGEPHSWPIGTPRKDAPSGESFMSLTSPNKTAMTPSKLISTWSAISPCKFSSPNSKIQIPLNPAVLDESCLLEVPPSLPLRVTASSTGPSQRSYSILAEDLAVSLTIPSPLKSDSHLSFLRAENGEPASAPDSVISAHFSEDALMDGEDATEQDIHLALDSDNSSAGSNGGRTWEEGGPAAFKFKPHLPMQAVVMEKSNDHFIVRIRHASTSFAANPGPNPENSESGSQVVTGDREEREDTTHSSLDSSPSGESREQSQNSPSCSDPDAHFPEKGPSEALPAECGVPGIAVNSHDTNSPREPAKAPSDSKAEESTETSDQRIVTTQESSVSEENGRRSKKRKKHHSEPRAKRAKTEAARERTPKDRKKKASKGHKDKRSRTPKRKRSKSKVTPLSPNSLSAKNVIRRKGEVVVTWTREEDRDILIELKMKGASPETFSGLSAKINKSPSQIAERFCQLMKLFKKKERMES